MPFSFSPGQQEQQGSGVAAPVAQATQNTPVMNNGVPALVVPTIPNIAVGGGAPVEEKLSPFAFRNRNKSKFGIYFQFAVFAVFGCVVITAIGLFAYTIVLSSDINNKKEELLLKQSGFPDLPLEDMQKFSNRLKIVNRVMKEHSSVRTAFQIIEDSIENPVVYTRFTLNKNKSKNGYSLDVSAEAPNYHVIYQQMEALKSKTYSAYLSPVTINNIALDKSGIINFKLGTNVSLEGVHIDSLPFNSAMRSTDIVEGGKSKVIDQVNNDTTKQSTSSLEISQ